MPVTTIRSIRWSAALILSALPLALLARPTDLARAQEVKPPTPPVVMTAEQDHQRMMELLHITSLRPGANPNDPQAPNAVNYDESKANPYPKLPDPLVAKNGKRVTTARVWWTRR